MLAAAARVSQHAVSFARQECFMTPVFEYCLESVAIVQQRQEDSILTKYNDPWKVGFRPMDDGCPTLSLGSYTRLKALCEDCYNLYRAVELHALCR